MQTTLSLAKRAKPSLVGLGFEHEGNRFGLAAADGHFLRLVAVGFVPRGDCVLPGWQIRQRESSAVSGNCKVLVLHHREVSMHPGMHVTLHGNELRLVVFFADRWRSRWLGLVPLAVQLRQRVDVMRGLVLVHDLEFLVHLERQNVWDITASLLRKDRRRTRRAI